MKKIILFSIIIAAVVIACKKKDTTPATTPTPPPVEPNLVFKFKFDSTQVRLNNLGQPSTIPSSNRAQSPKFNKMSGHYIELAQNDLTAVGGGKVLYKAAEVPSTGAFTTAIDFSKSTVVGNGETFFSIPLKNVAVGSYKWLRVSLAYQNYDITYKSGSYYGTGTLASFVGYNTYIGTYTIKTASKTVNAAKSQGYWGFETFISQLNTTQQYEGQAPPGATTVVNPIFASSPIPAGSCLATGQFVNSNGAAQNLVITGNETKDIVITVSLSTNKSFEWREHGGDNYYEPAAGDTVVDMGIRGLIPYIQP